MSLSASQKGRPAPLQGSSGITGRDQPTRLLGQLASQVPAAPRSPGLCRHPHGQKRSPRAKSSKGTTSQVVKAGLWRQMPGLSFPLGDSVVCDPRQATQLSDRQFLVCRGGE